MLNIGIKNGTKNIGIKIGMMYWYTIYWYISDIWHLKNIILQIFLNILFNAFLKQNAKMHWNFGTLTIEI